MKLSGIKVHDARNSVVLHISKADAVSGKKDPANCAAAKAACRLPGAKQARVFRTRTYVLHEDLQKNQKFWRRYVTPASIYVEMISFDRGGKFEPGDYTLKPPLNNSRLGTPRSPKKTRNETGKSRPTPHVIQGIRERASGWEITE